LFVSVHLAIDFKPQHREAFVAVSNGMIFDDVAEVGDRALFRGREANDPEVTGVDRLYYRVDCSPLLFVQRKLYFSASKEPIVVTHSAFSDLVEGALEAFYLRGCICSLGEVWTLIFTS
jgi:hypothetical protein